MSIEFNDITIIEMDDEATYKPDPNSALYDIVLKLSGSAPYDWADYFNGRWQQHIYMMKRRANVSGASLTIHCVPDELQKDHIPELNKIITETNQKYKAHLFEVEAKKQVDAKTASKEKDMLSDLKNNLKF